MRVKFCGITNIDDAAEAVRLGAWAIGLIHFEGSPRRVEPGVEVPGADQRLHHVAEHVVAVRRAVIARLLAEPDAGGDAEAARDLRADRPGDERVQPLGQLALRFEREQLEQPFGDDEPEHPVAEELQPLIIRAALARMGQRALEPGEVMGGPAERLRQPIGQFAQNPSPIRRQRAADTQVHGLTQEAEPSVEKKLTIALPST